VFFNPVTPSAQYEGDGLKAVTRIEVLKKSGVLGFGHP